MRVNCANCAEEYDADEEARKRLGLSATAAKGLKLQRGSGCRLCFNTGYQGRTLISEVLEVSDDIRSMITKRSSSVEVEKQARREGMKTIYEDGLEKVLVGRTTLEELLAACEEE